jgi:AcrR family transcriptional regulator
MGVTVNSGRARQVAALKAAAARKARSSREAAEKGFLEVHRSGGSVTFAAVSRAAGVSTAYLRSQKDLAAAIVLLRGDGSFRRVVEPVCTAHSIEIDEIPAHLNEFLPSDPQKLSGFVRDLETLLEAARWKLEQLTEAP